MVRYTVTVKTRTSETELGAFQGVLRFDPDAVIEQTAGGEKREIYEIETERDIDAVLDNEPGVITWRRQNETMQAAWDRAASDDGPQPDMCELHWTVREPSGRCWLCEAEADPAITLVEAAPLFGLAYSTLAQAAREGRLEAWRSGATWLTTRAALQEAIESGKLNPRRKTMKISELGNGFEIAEIGGQYYPYQYHDGTVRWGHEFANGHMEAAIRTASEPFATYARAKRALATMYPAPDGSARF